MKRQFLLKKQENEFYKLDSLLLIWLKKLQNGDNIY